MEPAIPRRSLLWRFVPWLVPIGLIVIGLMFVTAGVTDSDRDLTAGRDATPANVTMRFEADAPAWAVAQVGPSVTTTVGDVVSVSAVATGASTYSARAVIVRHDAVAQPAAPAGATLPTLAEADTSTVATCVLWDVDVTNQVTVPRAAIEIVREAGVRTLTDTTRLRDLCRDAAMPP